MKNSRHIKSIFLLSILFLIFQLSCSKEDVPNTPITPDPVVKEQDEIKYAIKVEYSYPSKEKTDSLLTQSRETEITLKEDASSRIESNQRKVNDDIVLEAVEHIIYSLSPEKKLGSISIDISKTTNAVPSDIDLSLSVSEIPANFGLYLMNVNEESIPIEPNQEIACTKDPTISSSCSFTIGIEFKYNIEPGELLESGLNLPVNNPLNIELMEGTKITSLTLPTIIETNNTFAVVNTLLLRDQNPINENISLLEVNAELGQVVDIDIKRTHVKFFENCPQILADIEVALPIFNPALEENDQPLIAIGTLAKDQHPLIDLYVDYPNLVSIFGSNEFYGIGNLPEGQGTPKIKIELDYNCDIPNNFANPTSVLHTIPIKLIKFNQDNQELTATTINLNLDITLSE